MSMYVRVKRDKLTVFLLVDPTDTVQVLKQRLQELVHQPAVDQRLFFTREGVWLEDERSLAELGLESDDELSLVFRQAGGQFETVRIEDVDVTTANE